MQKVMLVSEQILQPQWLVSVELMHVVMGWLVTVNLELEQKTKVADLIKFIGEEIES
jgi:hypothetical protein